MEPTAYSPLKIFHHRDRIVAIRRGEYLAPLTVQLIPTNRCNQACEGCAYRLPGYVSNQLFNAKDEIPWDKLVEIVNDCQRMDVRAIEITGGGEPTVHSRFLNLCELILNRGIDLGLVTNGARWCADHTSILSQAKWVRFSLDAGDAETYGNYRHTSPKIYHVVRRNVRDLSQSNRAPDMIIGVGFVVTKTNWQEVALAAERARDDGADNFRISALFHPDGPSYFNGVYTQARDLCRTAEELTTKDFRVFNLFGDRLQDLSQCSPDYETCYYSRLTTYLGADCVAYTCCNNAYNERGIIGSFKDQSFRQMWFSDETKSKVSGINANQCPVCMYNGKNRAAHYAVDNNPQHVNFI